MIVLSTKVIEFGDGDVAIGAGIGKDGTGLIDFTDLSKNYEIGDKVPEEEKDEKLVILAFKKVESVDVAINALEKVKKLMKERE